MSTKQSSRSKDLVRLSGTIKNYRCSRAKADFMFTGGNKARMGAVAIAAPIAGLSGPVSSIASHLINAEEQADYVEFDLDEKHIKGWVWRSPFKEGDKVQIAAEWRNGHYEAAGIARPSDRTTALYPHCSRGRVAHAKNAVKWAFLGAPLFFLLTLLLARIIGVRQFQAALSWEIALVSFVCCGFIVFRLTRKWMVFVHLAENIFRTLGSPDPSHVDLVKSSKAQRKPDDPGEFGTFYFRY